ncbi:MAG: HAMP domain-containing histidine kinase [Rhodospirillales bacterium]|nr:HAMP domain-containing histidine kinase [Rhodospirillales bacterium]
MRRANLIKSSAFRLTLLYMILFGTSVLGLLAFIYLSTIAVIDRQTEDTIDAEVRGLAEQYREQGLARLIEVIRLRSSIEGQDYYLLTDPNLRPLAGNLSAWPKEAEGAKDWVDLTVTRNSKGQEVSHDVRAQLFTLSGGYRLLVGRDTHERTNIRSIVVKALGWSVAAAVGLGLVGGIVISRRMLRRVEHVARTSQGIMAGDLSRRMAVTGSGDEFDRLATSLNAMLDQIERLMTGMRLATDSLAHDLRSPLTRLRGRIELALRQPPQAARDREALADVLRQAELALSTFDSLLKIAMAEAGVGAADLRVIDLAAVARDAAELYEPVAEEAGIRLRIETQGGAMVRAQPELLAQSITNLIDNAVKNTPSGGEITVAVGLSRSSVTLRIGDTGPGIPAVDRQRVLDRFVRLEESRSTPGAGLGLSLVAAVAKMHGAQLHLGDAGPGLVITLIFPIAASAHDSAEWRAVTEA